MCYERNYVNWVHQCNVIKYLYTTRYLLRGVLYAALCHRCKKALNQRTKTLENSLFMKKIKKTLKNVE